MLARKYDNYAWEEQQSEVEIQQTVRRRQIHKSNQRKVLRRRLGTLLFIVLATYLVSVIRAEVYVAHGNELLRLQKQEALLLNKNDDLKIEVDQLKSPDRIIGLAEQNLGMSVARSNIYLKSASK